VDQFFHNGVTWVDFAEPVELEFPSSVFGLLSDGRAEIRFEVHSLGSSGVYDSFAIDYSELIVEAEITP